MIWSSRNISDMHVLVNIAIGDNRGSFVSNKVQTRRWKKFVSFYLYPTSIDIIKCVYWRIYHLIHAKDPLLLPSLFMHLIPMTRHYVIRYNTFTRCLDLSFVYITSVNISVLIYKSKSPCQRESRYVEQKYTLCVLVYNLYAMHLTPHMVITGDGAPKIALAQCMREKDMACAHCFHLSNLLMLLFMLSSWPCIIYNRIFVMCRHSSFYHVVHVKISLNISRRR